MKMKSYETSHKKIALVKKHILGQEVTSVGVFRILPVKKEPWTVGHRLY